MSSSSTFMTWVLGDNSYEGAVQSQIQDFPKGAAPFRVKCQVDAIQWGGGVVAEFVRGLRKPTRESVGGGVVPGIFRGWGPGPLGPP